MAHWGEYDCKHKICITCATRLIFLYRTNLCPMCKQKTKRVLYSDGTSSKLLTTRTATAEVIFSTPELKESVDGLLQNKCQLCERRCNTMAQLKSHYREHSVMLCNECVEGMKYFWYEHRLYRADTIKHHKSGRLKEDGFDGHVYCVHCSVYLFDSAAAKQHCIEKHEVCSVCTLLGMRHRYYNTFRDLEAHYRQAHYCCCQETCQSRKCYVFAYKTELFEHLLKHHGLNKKISDIADPKKCVLPYMDPSSRPGNSITILNSRSHIRSVTAQPSTRSGDLPEYLGRSMLVEERAREKRRRYWIEQTCRENSNEAEAIVSRFVSDELSAAAMFDQLTELVGDKTTLSLMEFLKFDSKQPAVDVHLREFRSRVMFPRFKPSPPVEYEEAPRQEGFGFKVIDMTKKRHS
jgi:E3 ubiquitin-protein ligase ZNF598